MDNPVLILLKKEENAKRLEVTLRLYLKLCYKILHESGALSKII